MLAQGPLAPGHRRLAQTICHAPESMNQDERRGHARACAEAIDAILPDLTPGERAVLEIRIAALVDAHMGMAMQTHEKLQLSDVTLVAIDTSCHELTSEAIKDCERGIDFGSAIVIT